MAHIVVDVPVRQVLEVVLVEVGRCDAGGRGRSRRGGPNRSRSHHGAHRLGGASAAEPEKIAEVVQFLEITVPHVK